MSLYDRLLGTTPPGLAPKISSHELMAGLAELEREKITAAQLATIFNLDAGEQTELATLFNRIIYPRDAISLGGFTTLTNIGRDKASPVDTINGFIEVYLDA